MNFFKKLLDSLKSPATQSLRVEPQIQAFQKLVDIGELNEAEAANLAAQLAGEACLDRHWHSVGTVERDVIAYMISPSFRGGPDWPSTRQAYRVVRRGDSIRSSGSFRYT